MSGETAASASETVADSTGDPYEDFPEDQPGKDEFTGPQFVKIATELKDFGNKAFKTGDLTIGLDKYQKGLRYLNDYPVAQDSDPAETAGQLQSLRFNLHSNSALLQNKLKMYDDAKASSSNALGIEGIGDPERAKAYFRRATAKQGSKDVEEALKDLEEAAKLAPGDPAITKELAAVKKKAHDQIRKEKAAFKKFFD